MCRRLAIDLKWDDAHANVDAGMIFEAPDFNTLRPEVEEQLLKFIEGRFIGMVKISVEPLP